MTNKFLSKDPAKAIYDLRDMMYERLADLREEYFGDPEEWALKEEIEWLESVIDVIERS